jgi:hypothetical protein
VVSASKSGAVSPIVNVIPTSLSSRSGAYRASNGRAAQFFHN